MPEKITEKEAEALLKEYPLPWTHAALGDAKYNKLSLALGYFNGAAEPGKPDLAPPDEVLAVARKQAAK